MPPRKLPASAKKKDKSIDLNDAEQQLVQEIDATSRGRKAKKEKSEIVANVGNNFENEPAGWIAMAVAKGRFMDVYPKRGDVKSHTDEVSELKAHVENASKAVSNHDGDHPNAQAIMDIFARNYITDLEIVQSLSLAELLQMEVPAGVAEKILHPQVVHAEKGPQEVIVPVMHTFLVKEIDESTDGELFVKGTFVQTQVGQTAELFEFRFNEGSATEDQIHMRRKTNIPEFGVRSTYNVVLPTKKKQVFSAFPFQIYQVTSLVELSTLAVVRDTGEYECRPDIRLWSEDERQLLVIRGVSELNSTDTYALVTASPKVTMLYDTKKKYCPKYEFAFYLTIPAMQSFFAVYMPMLLVTIYAAVNVLNDAESASQLDNAVAIATVIVFVLPQLNTESKGQDTFGTDEMYIVLMFIGLILTGLIHPKLSTGTCECVFALNRSDATECLTAYNIDDTDCQHIIAYFGMVILTIANCIPIVHVFWYIRFKNKIFKSSLVEDTTAGRTKPPKQNSVAPDSGKPVASARSTRPAFLQSKSSNAWQAYNKKKKLLDTEKLAQMTPCCARVKGEANQWEKSPMVSQSWRARAVVGKKDLIKLQCGPDHRDGY